MSSDNYNLVLQAPDGKWICSPNHSMSDLMRLEEYEAYFHALNLVRGTDPIFDTQAEAYEEADRKESEYGTFSHEWREWFDTYDE